tara:strand:+ start:57879 stop:58535 length:657 start_codon:yes stop_codon:yes gene_type:complete
MGSRLKLIFSIVALSCSSVIYGQYSAGFGLSSFHGANTEVNRFGFNAFFEQPNSDVRTTFLRATYMFPQKNESATTIEALDFGTQPQIVDARQVAKTSFFSVDGGNRIYFVNDYDIGFAVYGGFHLRGIISSFSREYIVPDTINVEEYNTNPLPPQYSLLLSFGVNAGAKYQLPMRGAITLDFTLDVVSRLYDPAGILGNEISPLSFSVNLAYRFDWY